MRIIRTQKRSQKLAVVFLFEFYVQRKEENKLKENPKFLNKELSSLCIGVLKLDQITDFVN